MVVTGLFVFVGSAVASKEVVDYIGSDYGSKGGEFWNPRDIATNATGAGPAEQGDIYVVEEFNQRIQRFDEDGNFISAWGANVLTAPSNEVQSIDVSATGGTYTLSFEGATTGNIAFDASAFEVGTALQTLPTMSENIFVSGSGPFTVSFSQGLSATDVGQIVADDSLLTGSVSTTTTTQGSGQFEICTVAANCRAGAGTGGPNVGNNAKNGSLFSPQSIAVDGDTGNVYVSDRRNRRINEYTGDGTFIRSFGFGVDTSTAGEGYEACPAADRCTIGTAGSGVGQIGDTGGFGTGRLGLAISPPDGNAATGSLFLADSTNRRVNTYDLDGANPSSFGSSTEFGTDQPRKLAVDSRGIVYASDSGNGGEIERYDSEDANGGGVGFLAPIASPPLVTGFAEFATAGLAVDPDSDGPGTDEDVLYVLRGSSDTFKAVVQQFGPTNDPGLTTAPAAVDDTHGSEAGLSSSVLGFGLDDVSGRLFISEATRVYILDEAPAPGVSIDPVTDFDAHSATLSGSVDPNGALSGYHFEYVDDAEFQANGFTNTQRYPLSDAGVGNGEDPVSVEQELPHHLVPGTTYHARLIAKRTFGAAQTVSSVVTFTTDSSAPTVAGPTATFGVDTANLRAAINPENQAVTNYHFNWGPTNAYGNSTPAGNLPSGNEPVPVEAQLIDLTPGTTYHYQLVATNGTGTTTGLDQTFTTLAAQPSLGPKRGYEIVTPNPTGGVPLVSGVSVPEVSPDGNRALIGSIQPFPHSVVPIAADQVSGVWMYGSDRTTTGWSVAQTGVARLARPWGPTLDLTRELTQTAVGLDPDDQNEVIDLYLRQPDGSLEWISRDPRIPVGTPQTAPGGVGMGTTQLQADSGATDIQWSMATDGSTVVFKSLRPLLDDDPGTASGFNLYLYKWQEGELSFLGHRPDGSVPANGDTALGSGTNVGNGGFRNVVSRDGSRVIWSAKRNENAGKTLYVQIDGQPTVEAVNETGVPTLPDPEPYRVEYLGADSQATRVFFGSSSRLTPDSGAYTPEFGQANSDLYVYDVAADKVRDLTPRLDGLEDPTVDPALQDRGRLLGVSAVSEDGKRVYFVADAQYDVAPNPLGQLPSAVGRNLYYAELDGIDDPIDLRFIGTLGPAFPGLIDEGDGYVWEPTSSEKMAYANPDGSVLAFASGENLTGQPIGGLRQMFVYDAERNTLECASCPPDGTLPKDKVNRYPLDPSGLSYGWHFQHAVGEFRWVSTRGTVFFDTVVPLVPGDQNSTDDVYEFNAGEVRLISAGTGSNGAKIENSNVDGSSVFFTTTDALAPQDEEPGVTKLYVAREGGGFPKQPTQPPCDINAGACEGPGTSAPQIQGAGTAQFSGPGNIDESAQERCKRLARKVKKLASKAARLRREARRATSEKRGDALRQRARRVAKATRKQASATKRCRRKAGRGANTDGRAGR